MICRLYNARHLGFESKKQFKYFEYNLKITINKSDGLASLYVKYNYVLSEYNFF